MKTVQITFLKRSIVASCLSAFVLLAHTSSALAAPSTDKFSIPQALSHMAERKSSDDYKNQKKRYCSESGICAEGSIISNTQKTMEGYLIDGTLPPSEAPYDRGADWGEVFANIGSDIGQNFSEWWDCTDLQIIGVCWKLTIWGPEFSTFYKYRVPVQQVENVNQQLKSGYWTKAITEIFRSLAAYLDGPDAVKWVGYDIETAGNIARRAAGVGGSAEPISEDAKNAATAVIAAMRSDEKLKEMDLLARDMNTQGSGHVLNEYHVSSAWFNIIFGNMAFYKHYVFTAFPWFSEGQGILPARISDFSYWPFFPGMLIMDQYPLICTSWNVAEGKTDPLLLGKDGLISGLVGMAAGQLGGQVRRICQGTNQGPWVPTVHRVRQEYAASAAAIGFRQGSEVVWAMQALGSLNVKYSSAILYLRMAFNFYKYHEENMPNDMGSFDDGRDDLMQWVKNDRMRTGCGSIEQFSLEMGDHGNASMQLEGDHMNVGYNWRRMRVCQDSSHSPLFTWTGDDTSEWKY